MKAEPLTHQAELLSRFGSDMRPLLLAGCVGSGKTMTALLLDQQRRLAKPYANPTLIICPASVKFNWAEEVEAWLECPATIIDGPKAKRLAQMQEIEQLCQAGRAAECRYVITNFDTVRIHWQWFQEHHWYQVIIDEAHNIKTPTTLRTRTAKAPNCYSRIALTGTPIANKPNDLWSLLHFLQPGDEYLHRARNFRQIRKANEKEGTPNKKRVDKLPGGLRLRKDPPYWGTYHSFIERYCAKNRYGGIVRGRNLDELHIRLQDIMVRWKKEEVLSYLPALHPPHIVQIELTPQQHRLYEEMKIGFFRWVEQRKELRAAIQQEGGLQGNQYFKEVTTILAQLTYFRRITSMSPKAFAAAMAKDRPDFAVDVQIPDSLESAKAAWIRELIEYKLDDDEKVVILSNWVDTLQELRRLLAEYEPVLVAGGVSAEERQEAAKSFKKVFLGSPAAFEGINLQSANTLVWVDLPWNATQVTQGNGRIHRIGQQRECDIFFLLAQNTVDERVFAMNRRKASDIAQAIDGGFTKELLQFGLQNLI